jgi:hypothetical protein
LRAARSWSATSKPLTPGGDFVPLGLKVEQQTLRQVNLILDDQNSRHRKRW